MVHTTPNSSPTLAAKHIVNIYVLTHMPWKTNRKQAMGPLYSHLSHFCQIPHNLVLYHSCDEISQQEYITQGVVNRSPETQKQTQAPADSQWQRLRERQREKAHSFYIDAANPYFNPQKTFCLRSVNSWLMCLLQKHSIITYCFLIWCNNITNKCL